MSPPVLVPAPAVLADGGAIPRAHDLARAEVAALLGGSGRAER